jgi:hypothetical protein
MKSILVGLVMCQALIAASPVLTELQPRGAQKGKTLTLTLAGRNLSEGATVITTLAASFTPLTANAKGLPFLVELKPDTPRGVSRWESSLKSKRRKQCRVRMTRLQPRSW